MYFLLFSYKLKSLPYLKVSPSPNAMPSGNIHPYQAPPAISLLIQCQVVSSIRNKLLKLIKVLVFLAKRSKVRQAFVKHVLYHMSVFSVISSIHYIPHMILLVRIDGRVLSMSIPGYTGRKSQLLEQLYR
jgi:hypothetical protein